LQSCTPSGDNWKRRQRPASKRGRARAVSRQESVASRECGWLAICTAPLLSE
jgi:hypothetical protein